MSASADKGQERTARILRDMAEVFDISWVNELKETPGMEWWNETELFERIPPHQFFYRLCFSKSGVLVRTFFDVKNQKMHAAVWFGPETEGPPGSVHGGALATVLDQMVGNATIRLLGFNVTAKLSLNYSSFVPLNRVLYIETTLGVVEGRKRWVKSVIKHSPTGSEVLTSCEALMISKSFRQLKTTAEEANKSPVVQQQQSKL